ncbi:hypothetical protein WDH52_22970 [Streptomyces sp. TRM70308]|uniref:hypothetical protein n=1 Tax=Streptomyces sp. TRM70308 TaxID=3131932 RepID=UPI003CFD300B
MVNMEECSVRPVLDGGGDRDGRACALEARAAGSRCAEAAYAAFCREHWPVYSRFATAVVGSAPVGRDLARAALRDLGAQWTLALRSASPSRYAWTLLAKALAPHRAPGLRALYGGLRCAEADALVLRHRLGCSVAAAGRAMGLSPDAFELLRRTALANAAHPEDPHMPPADAA